MSVTGLGRAWVLELILTVLLESTLLFPNLFSSLQ